jgi:hypothetical protein
MALWDRQKHSEISYSIISVSRFPYSKDYTGNKGQGTALSLRRARFPAEAQFVHRAKFARQGTVFQSPVTGHYSKEGEDFLPDVNLYLYTIN